MSGGRKLLLWGAVVVALGVVLAALIFSRRHNRPMSLRGAVIRQDTDPKKELPIGEVQITAIANDSVIGDAKSDSSGFFGLVLRTRIWIGRPITLRFRHADYQPLDLHEFVGDKVYVARMVPIPHETHAPNRPDIVVSNVLARYSIKTTTAANVGSAVRYNDLLARG